MHWQLCCSHAKGRQPCAHVLRGSPVQRDYMQAVVDCAVARQCIHHQRWRQHGGKTQTAMWTH